MIIGVLGRIGSGKSAFMTALAYDYSLEGYTINANYGLSFPYTKINNSNFQQEIDRTSNKHVVIIDELAQNVKTRTINTIDIEIVVSQIRKFITERSHLIYSVQLYTQIPLDLLQLSEYLFKCSSDKGEDNEYIITDITTYIFNDITFMPEMIDSFSVDLRYIFGKYDTYEHIKPLVKSYDTILGKYSGYGDLTKGELKALLIQNGDASSISEASRIVNMISLQKKVNLSP